MMEWKGMEKNAKKLREKKAEQKIVVILWMRRSKKCILHQFHGIIHIIYISDKALHTQFVAQIWNILLFGLRHRSTRDSDKFRKYISLIYCQSKKGEKKKTEPCIYIEQKWASREKTRTKMKTEMIRNLFATNISKY